MNELQILLSHMDTQRDPMVCLDCGWTGRRKDCQHKYAQLGLDDVELTAFCPHCGSEQIWEDCL